MPNECPVDVAYLAVNAVGRDFIVGDIHGCSSLVDRLLAGVAFDPKADRLLSVGDLIDRGPSAASAEAVLDFLDKSWFYAVRGNHEQLLVDAVSGNDSAAQIWMVNGGWWATEHLDDAGRPDNWLCAKAEQLARLPDILVVDHGGQRHFNIVHAELPFGVGDLDIDNGFDRVQAKAQLRTHLLWSRAIMEGPSDMPVERVGLSPTFCGHTKSEQVRVRNGHICLDTGAHMMASFTGLSAYSVSEQKVYRVGSDGELSTEDLQLWR